MRRVTLKHARDCLHAALDSQMCTSAWIGAGGVLFFGTGSLHELLPAERHALPMPEWELQTTYAAWSVSRSQGVFPYSSEEADLTASSLVGLDVVGWSLLAAETRLTVYLAGSTVLTVDWRGCAKDSSKEAWCLRMRSGEYLCADCRCRMYICASDEPVSDRLE